MYAMALPGVIPISHPGPTGTYSEVYACSPRRNSRLFAGPPSGIQLVIRHFLHAPYPCILRISHQY